MSGAANGVLGQGADYTALLAAARTHRMHHGVLIVGARGTGKSMVASRLVQALLCSGESLTEACGTCPGCLRGVSHPDFHSVRLPEDKLEIPVGLVRELRTSLSRLPVEGRARVVLIDPADRLNTQGQNALLKTLEEPGHETFLLLTTSRPEGLLDTVRSRLAQLRILPLEDQTLRAELGRRHPDRSAADLDRASEFSTGSLGQAELLLCEENRLLFDLLAGFLTGAGGTPVSVAKAALHGASSPLERVERSRLTCWMLRALLRKELRAALAIEDTGPYSVQTSVRWTVSIESLIDAETDLSLRIPPEQVLVEALFNIFPQAR